MRAGNFVAALLTIGLGLFMVIEAGKMNIGFTGELHAGIFPRLVGIGFLLLGTLQLFQECRSVTSSQGRIPWPAGEYRQRAAAIGSAILVYLLALPWLGFGLTTFLFTVFCMKVLGNYQWALPVAIALLTSGLSTLVFQVWLDLRLPGGLLGY